jgi:hypothetical protein
MVGAHLHLHAAAAHLLHGGVELAPRPAPERSNSVDRRAGLQAQHLRHGVPRWPAASMLSPVASGTGQ